MNEIPHVLVVDDDVEIRRPLRDYLVQHGFRVSEAANAAEATESLSRAKIDLVVLDIMMPGESGLEIAKRLSATDDIPVIFLSALSDETDRIVGIELGADDYVCKPFNPRELVARVRAVLRRAETLPGKSRPKLGIARFDRWRFDLSKHEICDENNRVVGLTTSESSLLSVLVRYPAVALSRDQLLELTKGREAKAFDRSIDNRVSRLRQKIEHDPSNPRILITKWGSGYVFAAAVEWEP